MSDERAQRLIVEATKLRYSRRTVLRRAAVLGLSAPAIAGVLGATGHAVAAQSGTPAVKLGGSLNILQGTYYVPAAQDFFAKQAKDWGTQNGVNVTTDFINWPDLQPRTTSAVQAGSGPDIVEMWDGIPYLFSDKLVDVQDIAEKWSKANGGFYDWVTKTASINGQWKTVPHGTSSIAVVYRTDLFDKAGFSTFPETWEDLFKAGKTLKEQGHPIGQALGHSLGDPPSFCYPFMWAYGAMEVESDGKTIAFNKPQFVDGMKTFIQAWKDGYDDTGLGWDDSSNNSAYLAGQISATLNGSSIYLSANDPTSKSSNPDLAKNTNCVPLPKGPAGQFCQLGCRSLGIMSYSKNQGAAKAFFEWFFSMENYKAWIDAYKGYIIPTGPTLASDPVYTSDPKLKAYIEVANYGRNKGYAGPANLKSAQVAANYIVVDTFANAVQNGDAAAAIEQGARQLERYYGR